MKFRNSAPQSSSRIEVPMAPMIDVVFQLLIFFMLTLKIIAPEGDFNINMPIGAPSPVNTNDLNLPEIKVRLVADAAGNLAQLQLGGRDLGNSAAAFEALNEGILKIIGKPGNPLSSDIEVEIDADYRLHYRYLVQAISKCTGRIDPVTGEEVRYVEKIKLAPARSEDAF